MAFCFTDPQGFLALIMIITCAFVNGWTDAPTAITAVVATKALSVKKAAFMAGIFNLLGAIVFILINKKVALTVFGIADLGNNYSTLLSLLISSLASVSIWSVIAWFFGIPTSESHGILAAISGASFFLHKSFDGINLNGWISVFIGIIISITLGGALSLLFTKTLLKIKRKICKIEHKLKRLEIFSSMLLAFMHGAQDSQKFAGLVMILILKNGNNDQNAYIPILSAVICGLIISIGTALSGSRIIKKTGTKMVELDYLSGLCSNLSSALAMLCSSFLGLAVSTTHSSTASLLGAATGTKKRVSKKDTLDIILAWILTFPACFFISYLICVICL